MELVIKFTEHSCNPNAYNTIHCNLRVPYTQYSRLVIDSLTTNACIEVLNNEDYITFECSNGETKKIQIMDRYSSLNATTVSTLLNDLLITNNVGITTFVDNTNRIVFTGEDPFTITDCTYNLGLVLGLYDQRLPLIATSATIENQTVYAITCVSVGQFLSTPILYLLASIGEKCFVNDNVNRKILMRINNSYSANFPVIANNAEFSTYALSNDFSDITFELVDAHFRPVKLLAPMYLCGSLTGDPRAETINTSILITPELLNKNNVNNANEEDQSLK